MEGQLHQYDLSLSAYFFLGVVLIFAFVFLDAQIDKFVKPCPLQHVEQTTAGR